MRRASEAGASLVEYALLLALIVIVVVVAVAFLGGSLSDSFDNDASTLRDAPSGP
ncbi:MAG: Flp family type IVb pilin [Acidimicrobiia bacterium]